MLSLKKLNQSSIPLCQISGGKHDEKIVYFSEACDNKNTEIEYNMKINGLLNQILEEEDDYFSNMKASDRKKQKALMREHLVKNIEPLDDAARTKYHKIKEVVSKRGNTQLEILDGSMIAYSNPDPKKMEVYYVCGPSNCGKSFFFNQYAKSYKKEHPKNAVILFSKLNEDETLDKNKDIQRIEINNEILEDPIQIEELQNSLIIFDDTLMIRDKKQCDEINSRLLKDCLETGRHYQLSICISNHLINQYSKTAVFMNESTNMVFFFKGNRYATTYCLKMYLGLGKKDINHIFNITNSRWFMICKMTCPMTIVHEHGVYIINDSVHLDTEKDTVKEKTNKFIRKSNKKMEELSTTEESDQEFDESE